jgi:hypothetical protein
MRKMSEKVTEVLNLISNGVNKRAEIYNSSELFETMSDLSKVLYECVRYGFAYKVDDVFQLTLKGEDAVSKPVYKPTARPNFEYAMSQSKPEVYADSHADYTVDKAVIEFTKAVNEAAVKLTSSLAKSKPDIDVQACLAFIDFAEGVAKLADKDCEAAKVLRGLVNGG